MDKVEALDEKLKMRWTAEWSAKLESKEKFSRPKREKKLKNHNCSRMKRVLIENSWEILHHKAWNGWEAVKTRVVYG